MAQEYDFKGWATRCNIKCSDGRTIMPDAFKDDNGLSVPIVWNHQHNSPADVLGHAVLENRGAEGVYAYGVFNNTEDGQRAKELVRNKDITALSIYATGLIQNSRKDVQHGRICELSLVHAGANRGAVIEQVLAHSIDGVYEMDDEAIISVGSSIETEILEHSDNKPEPQNPSKSDNSNDKTVQDVVDSMTPEQKTVMYALVGAAMSSAAEESDEDEGGEEMKQNAFEGRTPENTLSHAEISAAFADISRYGTLRDSCLQHNITDIEWLFPEHKNLNNPPEFITREMDWVSKVMNGVHHSPFSRIKSMYADLTGEEARAKGYIKGKMKKEQVFTLLKRTTDPTTIYKKQKFHRDDLLDITDFDAVGWVKIEMRFMLNEELARAYIIGDGRPSSSDDKIDQTHIRPIAFDDDLFTIKANIPMTSATTGAEKAKAFIRESIKRRKDYRGSGNITLFITNDLLSEILLLEDANGRFIYESMEKIRGVLRVQSIVEVPVMDGLAGPNGGTLEALAVDLRDYNVGADKGGAVNMFDDFNIDYNQQIYLIETRCSGALTKPYSAIAYEFGGTPSEEE